MPNTQPKIFVAGHRGMVGSAIVRALQSAPRGMDALFESGAPAANELKPPSSRGRDSYKYRMPPSPVGATPPPRMDP